MTINGQATRPGYTDGILNLIDAYGNARVQQVTAKDADESADMKRFAQELKNQIHLMLLTGMTPLAVTR